MTTQTKTLHFLCCQLAEFRHLHKRANKYLTHNSRPVQPLSGRPIWYNTASASSLLKPTFVGFLMISVVPLLL